MRRNRILIEGARYHVVARANRREMILRSDDVKDLFLRTIRRAKGKYSFSIENFCIMENHFHLMIKPGRKENLSRIMQWIMSVFAMTLNRHNGWSGHIWSDRFYSKIIDSIRAFSTIFHYIDENPVKANLARASSEWKYCGAYWRKRRYCDLVAKPPFPRLGRFHD